MVRKTSRTKKKTVKKPKKLPRSVSMPWDVTRNELLADPKVAVEYIKEFMEDQDEFITAIKHVVQAQGISKIAKKAGIPRESLHRMLSRNGNPRYENLILILKALGFRLSVEYDKKKLKRVS